VPLVIVCVFLWYWGVFLWSDGVHGYKSKKEVLFIGTQFIVTHFGSLYTGVQGTNVSLFVGTVFTNLSIFIGTQSIGTQFSSLYTGVHGYVCIYVWMYVYTDVCIRIIMIDRQTDR